MDRGLRRWSHGACTYSEPGTGSHRWRSRPRLSAWAKPVMVNVAGYFNDQDGDALAYTTASLNAAIASVAVTGSVVTITAAAQGVVSVTVTASDPGGLSTQQTLTVIVPNRGPTPTGTIPAQSVFVGETAPVDMSTYFNDPDGDALTFSAASSNATVVSVSVAGSVGLARGDCAGHGHGYGDRSRPRRADGAAEPCSHRTQSGADYVRHHPVSDPLDRAGRSGWTCLPTSPTRTEMR